MKRMTRCFSSSHFVLPNLEILREAAQRERTAMMEDVRVIFFYYYSSGCEPLPPLWNSHHVRNYFREGDRLLM